MIAKKKSLSKVPKNLVHEKARLKQQYLAAASSGNESEAEIVLQQIEQLEELAQGSRERGISRENQMFFKVNERNRRINMLEMREAERREVEERRRTGNLMAGMRLIASIINRFCGYGSFFTKKNNPQNLL
jgi:hypothetical protein